MRQGIAAGFGVERSRSLYDRGVGVVQSYGRRLRRIRSSAAA